MTLWQGQDYCILMLLTCGYIEPNPDPIRHPWARILVQLQYIVGFWLVEMAISTNQKPTIYRNLYENTGPVE